MEKKGRKEGLLEKTAEVFDLPGDVVAGLPRVELLGDHQLRMENHKGILTVTAKAECREQIGREVTFEGTVGETTPAQPLPAG